jgi:hypothetical protein
MGVRRAHNRQLVLLARHAVLELRENDVRAQEAALSAAALANCPGEAGLDGGRALVDVVAVKAQARLQTQAVAGAETSQLQKSEISWLEGCIIRLKNISMYVS